MLKSLLFASALAMLLMGSPQPADVATPSDDLDAYWEEVTRTIREGDFEGYAATYHEDAVLVSLASETSYPIAEALAGWKHFFDDTKAGKATANVEFRFTQLLRNETTAHYTGIFRFEFVPEVGEASVSQVHLEALMVNKDGWKLVMEYQKEPATDAEWAAAR